MGIRNILLKDFRPILEREDKGTIFETAVLLHLLPLLQPNMELRFWRTKKGDEVDFIVLKNRIPLPIEVKSYLTQPEVPKGFIRFLKYYPQAPYAVVFNAHLEETVKIEGKSVYFKPWNQAQDLEYLKNVI